MIVMKYEDAEKLWNSDIYKKIFDRERHKLVVELPKGEILPICVVFSEDKHGSYINLSISEEENLAVKLLSGQNVEGAEVFLGFGRYFGTMFENKCKKWVKANQYMVYDIITKRNDGHLQHKRDSLDIFHTHWFELGKKVKTRMRGKRIVNHRKPEIFVFR